MKYYLNLTFWAVLFITFSILFVPFILQTLINGVGLIFGALIVGIIMFFVYLANR